MAPRHGPRRRVWSARSILRIGQLFRRRGGPAPPAGAAHGAATSGFQPVAVQRLRRLRPDHFVIFRLAWATHPDTVRFPARPSVAHGSLSDGARDAIFARPGDGRSAIASSSRADALAYKHRLQVYLFGRLNAPATSAITASHPPPAGPRSSSCGVSWRDPCYFRGRLFRTSCGVTSVEGQPRRRKLNRCSAPVMIPSGVIAALAGLRAGTGGPTSSGPGAWRARCFRWHQPSAGDHSAELHRGSFVCIATIGHQTGVCRVRTHFFDPQSSAASASSRTRLSEPSSFPCASSSAFPHWPSLFCSVD